MLPNMDQNTQIVQIQNHVHTENQLELVLEEKYEQIISLKIEYYLQIKDIQGRLSTELNQVNTNMLQLEKLTYFQNVLDRLVSFLDLNKDGLKYNWNYLNQRFDIYQTEIMRIIQIQRDIFPPHKLDEIIDQYIKLTKPDPNPNQNQNQNQNLIMNESWGQEQAGPITGTGLEIGPDMNEDQETQDWRLQFECEARQRAINWIVNTLKSFLREVGPEQLIRLQKSAERLEERIYNYASSQQEYKSKLSNKMAAAKEKAEELQIAKQNNNQGDNPKSLVESQGLLLQQTETQMPAGMLTCQPTAQPCYSTPAGMLTCQHTTQPCYSMPAGMLTCQPTAQSCYSTPAGATDEMEVQHNDLLNPLQKPFQRDDIIMSTEIGGDENSDHEPPQKRTKRNDDVSDGILMDNYNVLNRLSYDLMGGFDDLDYHQMLWP